MLYVSYRGEIDLRLKRTWRIKNKSDKAEEHVVFLLVKQIQKT